MYVKINSEKKKVKLLRGELAVGEARWEQGEVRWGRGLHRRAGERKVDHSGGSAGGREGRFEGTDLRTWLMDCWGLGKEHNQDFSAERSGGSF